jgi:ribonuclease-3
MKYQKLKKQLGIKVKNEQLFDTAFIHRSYLNEQPELGIQSNERMEFLGDAVLELVVTEVLYGRYPDKEEGELTNIRSALVKGEALAVVAHNLELGQFLVLSKGEEKSGGREKNYILANTTESLIGAIYLDEGYEKAHEFIKNNILCRLDEVISKKLYIDAKSHFQEQAQAHKGVTPHYTLTKESGPDHNKIFTMSVNLSDEIVAEGDGSSKQTAEQDAARKALEKLSW